MVGYFSKRIRALQTAHRKQSERIASKNKRGMIPKHEAVTEVCEKCGKNHSINEHRFHGEVSHLRTHGDEAEGAVRYGLGEFSVGKKSAAAKKIGSMQKALAAMPIATPRGKKSGWPGAKGWPTTMSAKERKAFAKGFKGGPRG